MKKYLAIVLAAFLVGTGVHVWATLRFWEYEHQLTQCRGITDDAQELANQLLSDGRFIRQYDAATGRSIYKFDYKWHRAKPLVPGQLRGSILAATKPPILPAE
jgi:hypothetical protein